MKVGNYVLKLSTYFLVAIALPLVALSQSGDSLQETEELGTTTIDIAEAEETQPDNKWFKTQTVQLYGRSFNDFVLSPGKFELSMNPGESRTFEISVANRLDNNRTFRIEIEDFTASNDLSRGVELLGGATGPYTLKDYVEVGDDTFTIDLGARAIIPVTITLPDDAEPGGRYGSVLISTVQKSGSDASTGSARPSSPIVTRVGTLIFLTVLGDIDYSGSLKQFTLTNDKLWFEEGPIDFSILYENTGTTHVSPYGELKIINLFGETVGFVEIDPWFALPNSLRLKQLSWDREVLFGRYTANLRLNRGYDDIIDESTLTFWVLPWKMMATIFVGVFIIVFIFRFIIKNFEFKRKK